MHTGGKHRIDEARCVSNYEKSWLPKFLMRVRIILSHAYFTIRAIGHAICVRKQIPYRTAGRDQFSQSCGVSSSKDADMLLSNNGTYAGQRRRERDVPEPTFFERGAED